MWPFFLVSSMVLGLLNQSDRIARVFNWSGTARAVALDMSKAFDRVWHGGHLHKVKSYGISGQVFGLISSYLFSVIDGLRWFGLMRSLHKNIQLMLKFLKAPFSSVIVPILFLLCITGLPDDVIRNIAIYTHDTTLYSKCDQASDLQDPVNWGRKWLAGFNAGKTQLV